MGSPIPAPIQEPGRGRISRVALSFTSWAEKWVPDAFVFALGATVLVLLVAAWKGGVPALDVIGIWGDGIWDLLPFTLQMAMVIITGYVLATTPPARSFIGKVASIPNSPKSAIAMIACFAMLSSWLNWGFSLIFSAMLAKETARRVQGLDYRTAAASSFVGLGSVWAQGLSGSAALQMATASSMTKETRAIVAAGDLIPGGVIAARHTIFLWQSLVSVLIEIGVVTLVLVLATPSKQHARTVQDLGITLDPELGSEVGTSQILTPGERLENSPWLSLTIALAMLTYLARFLLTSGRGLDAVNLNTVNLFFFSLGILLHRTPARLMRAFREAAPGVWGVLLQFPFYAGIAAVISKTHLSEGIARFFVGISTRETFPALVAAYSALLGILVPSGGSKWVIEAPYVMAAAHHLKVHLGWVVASYDLGEALANLIQPFWMLPILGLFQLRARDVMGTTFLLFLVLAPVVLVLVTVLGMTLAYPLLAARTR